MEITAALRPDTAERVVAVLSAIPEVRLIYDESDWVAVGGKSRHVVLLPRPPSGADRHWALTAMAEEVPRGATGLVVALSLPQDTREALESASLSWCDARGSIHLEYPGVYVHIDRTSRRLAMERPSLSLSLGVAGIRTVQTIIENPEVEWSVARLADAADVSVGQAHKVLNLMRDNRLIESSGRGPNQRRVLTDRSGALDWLEQIDGTRRRPTSEPAYLYARTANELLVRFDGIARNAGVEYAVTGAAAAQLMGVPVLSRVTVAQIRVDDEPYRVVERMGLEGLRSGEKGNIELLGDVGGLGTHNRTEIEGIDVAPAVRVWLDLSRLGGRGPDAAEIFRRRVLERV